VHFERDMARINEDLLALFGLVEEMIDKSVRCLIDRRRGVVPERLAEEVFAADTVVDDREVRLEDDCLKILALHQPLAGDLRRVTTVLKINNDMERVGDLAVNIAERARDLMEFPTFVIPPAMQQMAESTTEMLRRVLSAFVHEDVTEATEILILDHHVDRLYVEVVREMAEQMRSDPAIVTPALHCVTASKHLERMADMATNIAEDLIYMIRGRIVRHRHKTLLPPSPAT